MQTPKPKPGPVSRGTFRLGMVAAAIVGLAAVGLLYRADLLTLLTAGYTLLVVFPVYLVLAASVLSVWLGYDKDATDLRPVYKDENA